MKETPEELAKKLKESKTAYVPMKSTESDARSRWRRGSMAMMCRLSVDQANQYVDLRLERGRAWHIIRAKINASGFEKDQRLALAEALDELSRQLKSLAGHPFVMVFRPGSMPWDVVVEGTKEFEEYEAMMDEKAAGRRA